MQSNAIARYGMPILADRYGVDQWVDELMDSRLIEKGVEISAYDRGDDGAEDVHVLIAIRDEDPQRVRSQMFGLALVCGLSHAPENVLLILSEG